MINLGRLLFVKYTSKDNILLTIIGNFMVMPCLFFAFFIYTHKIDKHLELASGEMAGELLTLPRVQGLRLFCA